MYSYFEFTDAVKNLLFYNLNSTTPSAMFLICLVTSIGTLLYELLVVYHELLALSASRYTDTTSVDNRRLNRHSKLVASLLSTLIYTVRVAGSMLLMLIVMTYNAWIFLSVILGSAAGYFLSVPARRAFSRYCCGVGGSPLAPQHSAESSSAPGYVFSTASSNALTSDT